MSDATPYADLSERQLLAHQYAAVTTLCTQIIELSTDMQAIAETDTADAFDDIVPGVRGQLDRWMETLGDMLNGAGASKDDPKLDALFVEIHRRADA